MTPNRLIIIGVVVALVSSASLVRGLRRGRFNRRGRYGRIDRRHQPVQFWTSVAGLGLLSLIGLTMLAWGLLGKSI